MYHKKEEASSILFTNVINHSTANFRNVKIWGEKYILESMK